MTRPYALARASHTLAMVIG